MSFFVVSNSRKASMNICLEASTEPETGDQRRGFYIGTTKVYKTPFMLDLEQMINPHIAILGMSGAGKSYLAKNFIIRARMRDRLNVIIVDWNSEYSGLVNFLGGKRLKLGRSRMRISSAELLGGVVGIDLSLLRNDAKKDEAAAIVLNTIIETMHRARIEKGISNIVVIDEAWRLLGNSSMVGKLFREGRKHGFSIIAVTQLVRDIDNEVIANSACIVVFRLQNNEDYRLLLDTGILNESMKDKISKLRVGSCMFSLALKSSPNKIDRFFIERVDGMNIDVYKLSGDRMQIEISGKKFVETTSKFFRDDQISGKILNFANENDRKLECSVFVGFLSDNGIGRADIVTYLRALGLDDVSIVRAYENCAGRNG